MSAVLELASEFVLNEGIELGAEDLGYGFKCGFLAANVVVDLAVDEVRRGSQDPVLRDLADLLRDEIDRVPEVLGAINDLERTEVLKDSARKWLYLQLKAAYNYRRRLSDPLGIVEQIYADFSYPPAVAPFVRYMPLRAGDEAGEAALIHRWASFLDQEREALARKP